MEVNEIITQLKDKFGDKIDVAKITETLKGMNTKGMSFNEIVEKIKDAHPLGDLDGDGKVESTFEEIKGKVSNAFAGMFHK